MTAAFQRVHDEIESAWSRTVRVRALCPYIDCTQGVPVGQSEFESPPYYRKKGLGVTVKFARGLTEDDILAQNATAEFVNRSFIVWMVGVLVAEGVTRGYAKMTKDEEAREGYKQVHLAKLLRNHFAHGEQFDPAHERHRSTREAIERLFPLAADAGPGFVTPIDTLLEPLTERVLAFVRATPAARRRRQPRGNPRRTR